MPVRAPCSAVGEGAGSTRTLDERVEGGVGVLREGSAPPDLHPLALVIATAEARKVL